MEYKEFLELKAKIRKQANDQDQIRQKIKALADHRPSFTELIQFFEWLIGLFKE